MHEKQQELENFHKEVNALANKFYALAIQEKAMSKSKVVLTAAMKLVYSSYGHFSKEEKKIVKESILELFK